LKLSLVGYRERELRAFSFRSFRNFVHLEPDDGNAKKKLCSVMEAVLSYFPLDVPIWIRSAWTITLRAEPPTHPPMKR
jgi:hypothetical protein